MSKLYNELAEIYELFYSQLINYENEFELYAGILNKFKLREVLDLACGTGNLAKYFEQNNFSYIGLDISIEMLDLAKIKHPNGIFILGDMRNFRLDKKVESSIITARSISYLLMNDEILTTFKTINTNLNKNGILAFDFIDANKFIPLITNKPTSQQTIKVKNILYQRNSYWYPQLDNGLDVKWKAVYTKTEKNTSTNIATDEAILRTFTINEIEVFLFVCGFEIVEIIERASYFFPTYVVVAQKMD